MISSPINLNENCYITQKNWMGQFLSYLILCLYIPRSDFHTCQSYLSANDKGDNEMKWGAVHKSPDIYFTAEENPAKYKLGDRMMKTVR